MRMDVSPRPPSIPSGVSIRLEDLLDQVHSLRYASSPKPWLDTEGNFLWSRGRINAARVVLSQAFETCMGLIILANMGLLAFEANQDAKCYPSYAETFQDCPYRSDAIDWSEDLSTALLLIYSLECLARAFVERQSYLCNPWNSLDFATVLVGWSGKVFTTTLNITFLRSFRLMTRSCLVGNLEVFVARS
ncbi:unnamed protein product [Effrenium voratum]|uniref:Ion transport domain-containing protein n=1 Tax=Effrenium voratum TaxID=2562239 RepID=A0AA36I2A1_9DINO|nr:unnamed protein product [Effrenium voratum]